MQKLPPLINLVCKLSLHAESSKFKASEKRIRKSLPGTLKDVRKENDSSEPEPKQNHYSLFWSSLFQWLSVHYHLTKAIMNMANLKTKTVFVALFSVIVRVNDILTLII